MQVARPVRQADPNIVLQQPNRTPGGIKIGGSGTANSILNGLQNGGSQYSSQIASLEAQIAAMNRPVYAPAPDIAGINARARQTAEGVVNPYYTLKLNRFLEQQKVARETKQQQYQTNVTNLQDALGRSLEDSQQNRVRTAEDTATNVAGINQEADQLQTDQGQQFTQDRLALARDASTGGLGAQKLESQQTAQNTTESRQAQKVQEQKTQQELFKSRTLDDLLKGDTRAKTDTEKGKKAAKFDLDNFIKAQTMDLADQKDNLEQGRLAQLAEETQRQAKLSYLDFFNRISNPAQKAAFASTYGSLL